MEDKVFLEEKEDKGMRKRRKKIGKDEEEEE